jgi:hypothetical protein
MLGAIFFDYHMPNEEALASAFGDTTNHLACNSSQSELHDALRLSIASFVGYHQGISDPYNIYSTTGTTLLDPPSRSSPSSSNAIRVEMR